MNLGAWKFQVQSDIQDIETLNAWSSGRILCRFKVQSDIQDIETSAAELSPRRYTSFKVQSDIQDTETAEPAHDANRLKPGRSSPFLGSPSTPSKPLRKITPIRNN